MKKLLLIMLVCILCVSQFAGCGKKKMTSADYAELARTNAAANAKKVVMTISKDGQSHDVTLDMMTYYLAYDELSGEASFTANKEYFTTLYGEDVDFWSLPSNNNNAPMKEGYKNSVYAKTVYTMILCYEAQEAGIKLTTERQQMLDRLTNECLARYTDEEKARCGMTADVIRANYENILLADQYNNLLMADITVDRDEIAKTVDKELYRVYRTLYIYLTNSTDNEQLNAIAGDTAKRRQLMAECFEAAKNGTSLEDLQKQNADIMVYASRDFQKAEQSSIEEGYLNAAYEMKVGEIRLLEFDYGTYVVKLEDNTEYYGYDDAVQAAVDEAVNELKGNTFNKIQEKYTITTTDVWDGIEMGTILKPKK